MLVNANMKWRENYLTGGEKNPKVFSIDLHDHRINLAESFTLRTIRLEKWLINFVMIHCFGLYELDLELRIISLKDLIMIRLRKCLLNIPWIYRIV